MHVCFCLFYLYTKRHASLGLRNALDLPPRVIYTEYGEAYPASPYLIALSMMLLLFVLYK